MKIVTDKHTLTISKKRVAQVAFACLTIFGLFGAYYFGQVEQSNADAAQIYQEVKSYSLLAAQSLNVSRPATQSVSGYNAVTGTIVTFFVEIYHPRDLFPRENLVSQNFSVDCFNWCFNGIHYFKDPTTLVTNQGHGFEDCKVFNPGSGLTDTCTAANFASIIGWSVSRSTGNENATDTWASTRSSCTTNEGTAAYKLITDANGLADVAASSVTDGGNGATTTVTLTKTFSITGTYTGINTACLNTALHGGTNPLIYAESSFGPDTFASGDSLTGTWTVSRT